MSCVRLVSAAPIRQDVRLIIRARRPTRVLLPSRALASALCPSASHTLVTSTEGPDKRITSPYSQQGPLRGRISLGFRGAVGSATWLGPVCCAGPVFEAPQKPTPGWARRAVLGFHGRPPPGPRLEKGGKGPLAARVGVSGPHTRQSLWTACPGSSGGAPGIPAAHQVLAGVKGVELEGSLRWRTGGVGPTPCGLLAAAVTHSVEGGVGVPESGMGGGGVHEVVRGTFEESLPLLRSCLEQCHFVAIDMEFSGLSNEPEAKRKLEPLDDLQQRYQRIRKSAGDFMVIQVGISAARWCSDSSEYKLTTFSFPVFPRPFNALDTRFTCQASSLNFLAAHGFDFNKFVYQGVPFLSLELLAKRRRFLERGFRRERNNQGNGDTPATIGRSSTNNRNGKRRAGDGPTAGEAALTPPAESPASGTRQQAVAPRSSVVVVTSPVDRLFVGHQLDRVREWVASTQPLSELSPMPPLAVSLNGVDSILGEDQPARLVLEEANSWLRAALYQALEEQYQRKSFYAETLEGPRGGAACICLIRATGEQVEELEERKREGQRRQLEGAGGFARAVEMLIGSKKPLVGHNMMLDVAHLFQHFIRPLPPTLDEFREQVLEAFPGGVFDTKYLISSALPSTLFPDGTSLSTVFTLFSPKLPSAVGAAGGVSLRVPLYDSPLGAAGGDMHSTIVDGGEGMSAESCVEVELPRVHHVALPWPPSGAPGGMDAAEASSAGSSFADKAHDAGYDASMTASVFSALCAIIPALPKEPAQTDQAQDRPDQTWPGNEANGLAQEAHPSAPSILSDPLDPINPSVRGLRDRLYVMRSDIDHLPLRGPLPTPDRSGTFLLSGLDPSVSSFSLSSLFHSAGLGPVKVLWVDSSSAVVTLTDPSFASGVPKALALQPLSCPMSITPWSEVHASLLESMGLEKSASASARARASGNGASKEEEGQGQEGGRPTKASRTENGSSCTLM